MELVVIDKLTRQVITAITIDKIDKQEIIISKNCEIKLFPHTQPTYQVDKQNRLLLTSDSFMIRGAKWK